ncbi:YkvA family protein [Oscillatoria sp. FACHB-1406]|uniref:YkvA family protein n=1 Tax=Oscillatoria sp. FACHB-1406 TaxID=2692846 RepID=UPI001682BFBC|nr:YkvA family protein [Oscillatoria sp. FACHB-1406]MBD2579877.1 DUF1232 domain-containing protein [Oscillatoria sp. FACHB-1406]
MRIDRARLYNRLKQQAKKLKQETYALYLAGRDRRVPWYARLLAVAIAAYLFSPLDLIPDFIPILGYLDDLILVPLGIWLVLKMIPPTVLNECRQRATLEIDRDKPSSSIVAAIIISLWFICGVLIFVWIGRMLKK